MRVRNFLVLVVSAGLLAVPVAGAAQGGGTVASARGGVHWTIPLPNQFGVEVLNQPLSFHASNDADGSVEGSFVYHQIVEGESFNFHVDVTCMNVYDGYRAKIGGVITHSNDPTLAEGVFAWFQVFDNGEGRTRRRTGRACSGSAVRPLTRPSATARTSHAWARGTCTETFKCSSSRASLPERSRARLVPGSRGNASVGARSLLSSYRASFVDCGRLSRRPERAEAGMSGD